MLGCARLTEMRDQGMSIAAGFGIVMIPTAPALYMAFQRSPADW